METLAGDLEALELEALSSPELRGRLLSTLEPGGRWLAGLSDFEPPGQMRRRLRRFDGFITKGGYRAIEVNQAAPLALHFHDTVHELSQELLEEAGISLPWTPLAPQLLDWLEAEALERFGSRPERIAVVLEEGYPAKFTDLPGMAGRLVQLAKSRQWDLEALCCLPHEVRVRQGRPEVDGRPVDLIWRNSVYLDEPRRKGQPIEDYVRILEHPERWLICNSTRAWLTLSKEALAVLWERGRRSGLPRTESPLSAESILAELKEKATDWVSKPCDSSFGRGVVFSRDDPDWAATCRARDQAGWVFQEHLEAESIETLDLDLDGHLVRSRRSLDYCPYQVNGKVAGSVLQRSLPLGSDGKTMNLVQGGALIPLGTHP
jgi:hypothetical protein